MTAPKPKDFLRPWKELGFQFKSASDQENYYTMCPFSGKEDKLAVNSKTGLWRSFTTDKAGNMPQFLYEYFRLCVNETTQMDLKPLAINRQTPTVAFEGNIAINPMNNQYMALMVDSSGGGTSLSQCKVGKKFKRLSLSTTSMYDTDKIKACENKIYIVEGEWDWIILKWLFLANNDKSLVVALPGANMFKDAFVPLFQGKDVRICFDNDTAGYEGQQKIANMLRPVVRNIDFLLWPDGTNNNYDVRDYVIEMAGGPQYRAPSRIEAAYKTFDKLFWPMTMMEKDNPEAPDIPQDKDVEIPSRKEVEDVFSKWLKMKSFDPLAVLFGTIFANKLQGDPVWLLLVAPPGGSKTELLMTLNKSRLIETVTTLTPPALISGYKFKEGADPSLLLKINNRILVIKDFTTILSSNTYQRDEIFAILRDAYDGYVEKYFGTGVKKSYHSKFGLIGAVTGIIDKYSGNIASLGERFIRFNLDRYTSPEEEDRKMRKAVQNINKENKMREEMQDVVWRLIEKPMPSVLPTYTDSQLKVLASCAKFTAQMRASVIVDKYTQEVMVMPFKEVGTRLIKQYMKQAMGMCVYLDKTIIDDEIIKLIGYIAVDTCPLLRWNCVHNIYKETAGDKGKGFSQQAIGDAMSLNAMSISRVLSDLMTLKIVVRLQGDDRIACYYRVEKTVEKLLKDMKIPYNDATIPKKGRKKFRI